jgi:CheY-like chemotaxis protein
MIDPTRPDVLISDMGNFRRSRELRRLDAARGLQTPAVALTAYASPQDRRLAIAAGFNTHIPKPIEPAEFVEVIACLAAESEARSTSPGEFDKIGTLWVSEFYLQRTSG